MKHIRGFAWGAVVVLLALTLLAAACQSGPKNLENFRKVQIGWSQDQVKGLLGEPDQVEEAAGLAGVWRYNGKDWRGNVDSTLIVTILAGRVMMVTLSSPVPR